jgi:hypothetical protein
MKRYTFALAVTILLTLSHRAEAQEYSVAALVGYGQEDAYGFGYGARAGVTLGNLFYVGLMHVRHAGGSTELEWMGANYLLEYHVTYTAGELGFEAPVGEMVTFRPILGLGSLTSSATRFREGVFDDDESESRFFISPGLLLRADLTQNVFAGASASYLVASGRAGGSANSLTAFVSLGFRFGR